MQDYRGGVNLDDKEEVMQNDKYMDDWFCASQK
jgi:hypothetical protein